MRPSELPPATAECYCRHQYLQHVSLEFMNSSLECLVDNCDCRSFKWTTEDRNRLKAPDVPVSRYGWSSDPKTDAELREKYGPSIHERPSES